MNIDNEISLSSSSISEEEKIIKKKFKIFTKKSRTKKSRTRKSRSLAHNFRFQKEIKKKNFLETFKAIH
jgi:hypothetical protein